MTAEPSRRAVMPTTQRQPYKKTKATISTLISALEKGASRTAAAARAGISLDTLSRWRCGDPQLEEQITQAEGRAEASMSEALFSAAQAGDWRAAEAWLKRRRREEWGDNAVVESASKTNGLDLIREWLRSNSEEEEPAG